MACRRARFSVATKPFGKGKGTSLISGDRILFRSARSAKRVLQTKAAGGFGDPLLGTEGLAAIDALPQQNQRRLLDRRVDQLDPIARAIHRPLAERQFTRPA